jgi:hypothetical protein
MCHEIVKKSEVYMGLGGFDARDIETVRVCSPEVGTLDTIMVSRLTPSASGTHSFSQSIGRCMHFLSER